MYVVGNKLDVILKIVNSMIKELNDFVNFYIKQKNTSQVYGILKLKAVSQNKRKTAQKQPLNPSSKKAWPPPQGFSVVQQA